MSLLALDTEVTGAQRNKGHPFDPRNKLMVVGFARPDCVGYIPVEYFAGEPYGEAIQSIQKLIDDSDTLVLFNGKFDLHWLRRYGITIPEHVEIWDCQLAYFYINCMSTPYPALNDALADAGIETKLDIVKTEYWEKGLDTDAVPLDILSEYVMDDVEKTLKLYYHQLKLAQKLKLEPLLNLAFDDELVLEEMVFNGIKYDVEGSRKEAEKLETRIQELKDELDSLVTEVPNKGIIKWTSNDDVSKVLFGGVITHRWKEPIGTYKSGNKKGQTKYGWKEATYECIPRLVPRARSATKKDGIYSVGDAELRTILFKKPKASTRRLIELLLELRSAEKLSGTYFKKLPDMIEEYNWENDIIHGQLDQVATATGRTNSSKPNLQNNSTESKQFFVSRYEN